MTGWNILLRIKIILVITVQVILQDLSNSGLNGKRRYVRTYVVVIVQPLQFLSHMHTVQL